MIKPLELFIGLRYTRAKRRNHFISFISLISIMGIALAVTVLITVLSVMNGFGNELRGRILSVVSHATVTGINGELKDWSGVDSRIRQFKGVVASAPYVDGQGMLANGDRVRGTMVRGILPEKESLVSEIGQHMTSGRIEDLKPGSFGIVIGSSMAWRLAVETGSQVSLIIPQALATPAGVMPRFKRFTVVGIFDIGHHTYDSGLVLVHMDDAAKLYRMGKGVSGLRLKLDDLEMAPIAARHIEAELGMEYRTRDWTREHANFFRALKIEKRVMLIILLLLVAIAAFNIVSTLVMVVTDKQSDIAIQRTLGMSPASIMKIFMVQGTIIGIFGTLVGVTCGLLLSYNIHDVVKTIETLFGFTILSADVYYITDVPSEIRSSDVLTITISSLIMSLIATLYPAWRASRVQPAQALRYE